MVGSETKTNRNEEDESTSFGVQDKEVPRCLFFLKKLRNN